LVEPEQDLAVFPGLVLVDEEVVERLEDGLE
jgi:hypothetical protein